jgi:hypothetical protein
MHATAIEIFTPIIDGNNGSIRLNSGWNDSGFWSKCYYTALESPLNLYWN